MKILAIESSCDDTAAAIVEDGRVALSSVAASQIEEHRLYGGVVPEIASRRHCETICQLVDESLERASLTLQQIDAIAVTYAPGLIGALLVGVNYAKGLAFASQKPLIPVHHLRSHIAANYLSHPQLSPPFLALVISGGHSHIVLADDYTHFTVIGRTRDDAVGEAFDKAARAMGFPYPGGRYLDQAAQKGNPSAFSLPHPQIADAPLDFSFSGLKTAVLNQLHNASQREEAINIDDLSASFQKTVCDLIEERLFAAAAYTGQNKIVVAGGVSANSGIRKRLQDKASQKGCSLYLPPLSLCGDNAAMVGSQAYYEYQAGVRAKASLNAVASLSIGDTICE